MEGTIGQQAAEKVRDAEVLIGNPTNAHSTDFVWLSRIAWYIKAQLEQ